MQIFPRADEGISCDFFLFTMLFLFSQSQIVRSSRIFIFRDVILLPDPAHLLVDGYYSSAQTSLSPVSALTLISGSNSLAKKSPQVLAPETRRVSLPDQYSPQGLEKWMGSLPTTHILRSIFP